jgi:cation diffusion facilitator CzcD-associated flavoprotein CzcO
MKSTATKYGLYRHIKFRTQVKTLVWNELNQKWHVKIYNKDTKEEEELLFDIV